MRQVTAEDVAQAGLHPVRRERNATAPVMENQMEKNMENEMETIVDICIYIYFPPIMENQMEKNMENELETGVM